MKYTPISDFKAAMKNSKWAEFFQCISHNLFFFLALEFKEKSKSHDNGFHSLLDKIS